MRELPKNMNYIVIEFYMRGKNSTVKSTAIQVPDSVSRLINNGSAWQTII
jgi:hypothetical protein